MWWHELIRSALIIGPTILVARELLHKNYAIRHWVAVLFAVCWQFLWHLMALSTAVNSDFLAFHHVGVFFVGVPVELILPLSVLMVYVSYRYRFLQTPVVNAVVLITLLCFFIGLTSSTSMDPVFILCLVPYAVWIILPSYYLYQWTARDQHIYLRTLLQNSLWAIVLLWLLPTMIFEHIAGSWQVLEQKRSWLEIGLFVLLVLPAYLIGNALYHFARYGNGTGFPFDAPKVLVTSGVYRFISNPMQLGIVMMQLLWGMILKSPFVIFTALVAALLFMVFKRICNGTFQMCGQDPQWRRYQAKTPRWLPHCMRLRLSTMSIKQQ